MKHTPEPWLNVRPGHMLGTYEIGEAEDHLSDSVALPGEQYKEIHKANAERIMACVNGCEGINPEAVPKLLVALEAMTGWWLSAEVRAALLKAGYMATHDRITKLAKAAIAEAKGIKEG